MQAQRGESLGDGLEEDLVWERSQDAFVYGNRLVGQYKPKQENR